MRGYNRQTTGKLYDGGPIDQVAAVEASSGVARITATMATDAGEIVRTFDLGGGETAWLRVGRFSNVNIVIDSVASDVGGNGAQVRLTWVDARPTHSQGLRLYQVVTGGTVYPVPRGATQLIARTSDASFAWRNTIAGGADTIPVTAGQVTRCLGDAVVPDVDNALIWLLEV